jgi:ABC-type nitrate/sulfonate/bicarbonate transport system substrate-binding protein
MESPVPTRQSARQLRVGYVPLSDCAPIAVAKETGIFERYGLDVVLSREPGWSGVRDKIYHGELDAAQSIAGIAFALSMGFGELRCEVAVPLILNLHGSAITLASFLTPSEIGSGEGLKSYLAESWDKDRPFTLAATHRFSSHHILLQTWLKYHGLSVGTDASIVFLPPRFMPGQLAEGLIDGFCVGEPWNSVAILAGTGWCPADASELAHSHPDKVLLMSGRVLRERRDESVLLVAALLEACKTCQDPSFREDLVRILAADQYTGASPEALRKGLGQEFYLPPQVPAVHGSPPQPAAESANRPTIEKASRVLAGLRSIGALPDITCGSLSRVYREDLFHSALHCCHGT